MKKEKKKELLDGPNLKKLRLVINDLNKVTGSKENRATKMSNRNVASGKNLKANINVAKAMTSELSGLIENCDKGKDPDYVNSFEKEYLVEDPETGVSEVKISYILDVEIPDLIVKVIAKYPKISVYYAPKNMTWVAALWQ